MQLESTHNQFKIYRFEEIVIHLGIQLIMLKYSMIINQKSIILISFNIEIQMLTQKIQPDNPKEEEKCITIIKISKIMSLTQLGR